MPKNVMKLLKPSPHRGRNDFDLSHRHLFDANFGELLPATCIETVPGDNIEMHASDLLRCIPLVTSPFLRAKQHLDVWFVPYRDLWHQFDSFITQKTEPVSSAYAGSSYLPYAKVYNLFSSLTSAQTAGFTDVVGRQIGDRAPYLLQLLGYGDILHNYGTGSDSASVNLMRLAAYNYIWYNEYRQNYFDDGTRLLSSGQNAAYLFNFDDLACTSVAGANIASTAVGSASDRLAAMMQMRYRCWKKDLYTGHLPSTQFGAVSTNSFVVNTKNGTPVPASGSVNFINIDSAGALKATNAAYSANPAAAGGNPYASLTGTGSLNVLELRKAEAVQIWRENALRAGNHVKDNMRAHYGVDSDFQDHRPTYLGSVSAPLNISDVMATAQSSSTLGQNAGVGDIAGKGLSSLSEKVFKYHAKEFGVIMVMFSLLPEAEYDPFGIERNNQLIEAEDFFIPEYENLGLEPISSYNFGPGTAGGATSGAWVVGYAPRYYGYKTKLDKVFGAFTRSGATTGVFRQWSSQRYDVTSIFTNGQVQTIPLSTFYVSPQLYDVNFSVSISNSPQFLCDMYFDVDAVRAMSVIGTPFS